MLKSAVGVSVTATMVNQHHAHLKIVAFVFYDFMLSVLDYAEAEEVDTSRYGLIVAYSTPTQCDFSWVLWTALELCDLMADPDNYESLAIHAGFRLTDFVLQAFYAMPRLVFYEAYGYQNRFETDKTDASVYIRCGAGRYVKYTATFRSRYITDYPMQLRIIGEDTVTRSAYSQMRNSTLPYLEFNGSGEDHQAYADSVAFHYRDEGAYLLRRLRRLSRGNTPQWIAMLRRHDVHLEQ